MYEVSRRRLQPGDAQLHSITDPISPSSGSLPQTGPTMTQPQPTDALENYSDDDSVLQSHGLTAVTVKPTSSPSPQPLSPPVSGTLPQGVSDHFHRNKSPGPVRMRHNSYSMTSGGNRTEISDSDAFEEMEGVEDVSEPPHGPSISTTIPRDSSSRSINSKDEGDGDTRLNFDPTSPLSLSHKELDGRDVDILSGENGAIEVVLGPAKGPKGHVHIYDQTGLIRDIKTTSAAGGGVRIINETRDGDRSNTEDLKAGLSSDQNILQPTVEDYDSEASEVPGSHLPPDNTIDFQQANVSTKRGPPREDVPATRPERPLPSQRRRPIVTQERERRRVSYKDIEECTDPNCTKCRPNVLSRHHPEILPSASPRDLRRLSVGADQRSTRSDPTTYYTHASPPLRRRQPAYTQGSAIIQPSAPPRWRASSTARQQRPMSYTGKPGAQYWVPGMPAPYPSPPQEHGPSPSASAWRNMPPHYQMSPPMEGRTLRMIPTENGMADIVIGARHGESTYASAPRRRLQFDYITQDASIVVNDSRKLDRRRSTQTYDKTYEDYVQARELRERLKAEAEGHESHIGDGAAPEDTAGRVKTKVVRPQKPSMPPSGNTSNFARNGPPPVVTQLPRDAQKISARYGQPSSAQARFPAPLILHDEAYESESDTSSSSSDEEDNYLELGLRDPRAPRALMPPPRIIRPQMGKKERPPIPHAKTTQIEDIDQRLSSILDDERVTRQKIIVEPSRQKSLSFASPKQVNPAVEIDQRMSQTVVDDRINRPRTTKKPSRQKSLKKAAILVKIDAARQSKQQEISKRSIVTQRNLDAQHAPQAEMPSDTEPTLSSADIEFPSRSTETTVVMSATSHSPLPNTSLLGPNDVPAEDHEDQLQDRHQIAPDTKKDFDLYADHNGIVRDVRDESGQPLRLTDSNLEVDKPHSEDTTTARSQEESFNLLEQSQTIEIPALVVGPEGSGKSLILDHLDTMFPWGGSREWKSVDGSGLPNQHINDTDDWAFKRNNRKKGPRLPQPAYGVHDKIVYDDQGYGYECDINYDSNTTSGIKPSITEPSVAKQGATESTQISNLVQAGPKLGVSVSTEIDTQTVNLDKAEESDRTDGTHNREEEVAFQVPQATPDGRLTLELPYLVLTQEELEPRDLEGAQEAQSKYSMHEDGHEASATTMQEYERFKQQTGLPPGAVTDLIDTRLMDNDFQTSFEWNYDDNMSAPSSYAASVASIFTAESLASSASNLSRGSGYSAVQIATATKELLAVVIEDEVLLSLYKGALDDPSIGPERLERNLRRLFKEYASLLENEATERLEYLASKLVFFKSGILAQSIVEKLRSGPASPKLPRNEHQDDSSDEEDDDSEARPVNEDAFEDLVVFREFLVGSEAFRILRAKVQAFVVPKLPPSAGEEILSKKGLWVDGKSVRSSFKQSQKEPKAILTWQHWLENGKQALDALIREKNPTASLFLALDAFFLATNDLLITTGQLEPVLKQGMTRLRWRCVCILHFSTTSNMLTDIAS
jgi:hypothetical protein